MHTVLFVEENSINDSLCSERISGQQQGSRELGIDHCERAWSDKCECCVLEQTARLSILGNDRELNQKSKMLCCSQLAAER